MNKYKKLISNTVVFAIGTLSSKALVFLLMPLYTRVLTTAQYGVTDVVVQTGNLLIPIVTLGISGAVLRFGLDKASNKAGVFTTGLTVIFCGFAAFLLLAPVVLKIKIMSEYTVLIYAFVLMSSLRSICQQFIRSIGLVRLFALDGILCTATTIGFNVLFLVVLKMGVPGYILAMICSDALSTAFLMLTAKLWRFVRFKSMNKSTVIEMLKYAIPLMPTTILWWITNVSDRYLVTAMIGESANGLYAISYKIPTFVVLFSTIFVDAWQLSAVDEYDSKHREKFFTRVFAIYSCGIFAVASLLILFNPWITKILVSKSFFTSWKYVPFLVLATSFSCLVNFLASIYMAEKKSVLSLITAAAGAVSNIVLNLILIPKFGVNGAAFATFFSYFLVFVLRMLNTRKFVKIQFNVARIGINTALLLTQAFVSIYEVKFSLLYQILIVALMMFFNVYPVIKTMGKQWNAFLHKRKKKQNDGNRQDF